MVRKLYEEIRLYIAELLIGLAVLLMPPNHPHSYLYLKALAPVFKELTLKYEKGIRK